MGAVRPSPSRAFEGDGSPGSARSVFWPTIWLAVALVVVKATYVRLAVFWDWARPQDYLSWLYLKWVAAASQSDLLFALGSGLVAAALLWTGRGKRRSSAIILGAFVGFGVVTIWYAVVSRQFFAYSAAPLTYQLLALGGDPRVLASSLTPYLTTPVIAAITGAPILYLVLIWGSPKLARKLPQRMRKRGRIAVLVVLLAWLGLGRQLLGTSWFEAQDRYVADGPHWVLAQSVALQIIGYRSSLGRVQVRRDDLCELIRPPAVLADTSHASLRRPAGQHPMNVILIVLESVGTQFLSLYGSPFATTPRLEGERASSLVFDSYYAPVGWTAYSLHSIVHAKRPPIKGYNTTSFALSGPQGQTMATVLAARGYRTAFMSAGDPDWASDRFFEGTGFSQVVRGSDLAGAKRVTSWGVQDEFLFDGMIEWVTRQPGKPFFLMAWTDQTHHPYKLAQGQALLETLPAELRDRDGEFQRYLTLIHAVDAQIGRLLDTLRSRGLAENTLVAITGDHGEAFGREHSGSGHGFTVYDDEVKVPLVLWNPRLFAGGRQSHEVGSHVDLSATMLDVLDVPAPLEWDGGSLLARAHPRPVFLFAAGWGENLLGVRDQNWKYVYDARRGRDELYDVVADPNEQHNLAGTETARVVRERERLAAWLRLDRLGTGRIAAECN